MQRGCAPSPGEVELMASGKKGDEKRLSGHCDDNVSKPHTTPSSVLKSPGIVVSRRKSLPVSAKRWECGKTTFVSASAVANGQVTSNIALTIRMCMDLTRIEQIGNLRHGRGS